MPPKLSVAMKNRLVERYTQIKAELTIGRNANVRAMGMVNAALAALRSRPSSTAGPKAIKDKKKDKKVAAAAPIRKKPASASAIAAVAAVEPLTNE